MAGLAAGALDRVGEEATAAETMGGAREEVAAGWVLAASAAVVEANAAAVVEATVAEWEVAVAAEKMAAEETEAVVTGWEAA